MAHKRVVERLKELRALPAADLMAAIETAQKAIYNIRRERLSKPQENVKETRTHRKEIARILTIKRQREIAAQKAKK